VADIYVRSTDGANADDGSTWALAKANLAGAAAIDAAGDRIFVSDNHLESTAGAVTLTLAGTAANPTRIICGDDAAEPPTAVALTGEMRTTGTSGSVVVDGHAYVYGMKFKPGFDNPVANINFTCGNAASGNRQFYEKCEFHMLANSGASHLYIGTAGLVHSFVTLKDCWFFMQHANTDFAVNGSLHIRGGGLLAGTQTNSGGLFVTSSNRLARIVVDGFDFSAAGSALSLVKQSTSGVGHFVFRNCKLPASWSGSLFAAAVTEPGYHAEMWNCDSGDTNYRMWVENYAGSIRDETTLVRTGGASDGDTPLAWKMTTTANARAPDVALRSPEIFSERITSVGAAKTITVEILHDSATNLKDDEIWLEVQYLGTSGVPLSSFANDAKADVLATAADQTASSETWTTTGMSNPNKQKLAVTFTPQEEGVAIVTVCLAKASYTVYVDPKATIT